jgi:predicted aspartyl protease
VFISHHPISVFDQCTLRIDVQRPRGRPLIEHPRSHWGIIDTGATGSVISRALFEEVGLEEFIPVQIEGPWHENPSQAFQTIAQLILYGDDKHKPEVRQMPLVVSHAEMRHGIILGMDALEHARFEVHGHEGWWDLEFSDHVAK